MLMHNSFDDTKTIRGELLDIQQQCQLLKELFTDKVTHAIGFWESQIASLVELIEASTLPFGISYADGRILTCNEAFCHMVGYEKEELPSLRWDIDLTPKQDLAKEQAILSQHHPNPFRYKKRFRHKNGNIIPVELLLHAVYDTQQNLLHYYCLVKDLRRQQGETIDQVRISQLKQQLRRKNKLLRETQRQLEMYQKEQKQLLERIERKQLETQTFLESARTNLIKLLNANLGLQIIISLPDLKVLMVNEAFWRVTGYPRDQVIGQVLDELELWPPGILNRHNFLKHIQKDPNERTPVILPFNTISQGVRIGSADAEIIYLSQRPCALVSIADVTEYNELEKRMAALESSNAANLLAIGIGHELRNPLSTVRGFMQMLGRQDTLSPHKSYFNLMIDELDRMNTIIDDFLTLKAKTIDTQYLKLNQIVEELKPMLMATALERNIFLITELQDVPPVVVDKNDVRQIILNLFRNAVEAMIKDNGHLTLKTYLCQADTPTVVLAVEDQGKGIDPTILPFIGTPFFTTKESGTGLGVYISKRIASRNNAAITIDTSCKGTTVAVLFPVNTHKEKEHFGG